MTRIESDIVDIENTQENVFAFLANFNNFQSLMPPQVTNWQSTEDTCTFTISGMATIGMKIAQKTPHSNISVVSDGKVPFNFTLNVLLNKKSDTACTGQILFEADLNPMLKMMALKPLTNFCNLLAAKMKDIK